jgi:hypothetical protein
MTISIDGTEIGEVIQIASIVGSVVTMLVVALVIYLLVRPPRRSRQARREIEPVDAGEVLALIDRMERRLDVLERSLPAEARDENEISGAGQAPELRRVK